MTYILKINESKNRLHLPILHSSHYQSNFIFHGPKTWNLLLSFIKDKTYNIPATLGQFKHKFKKFLIKIQTDGDTY